MGQGTFCDAYWAVDWIFTAVNDCSVIGVQFPHFCKKGHRFFASASIEGVSTRSVKLPRACRSALPVSPAVYLLAASSGDFCLFCLVRTHRKPLVDCRRRRGPWERRRCMARPLVLYRHARQIRWCLRPSMLVLSNWQDPLSSLYLPWPSLRPLFKCPFSVLLAFHRLPELCDPCCNSVHELWWWGRSWAVVLFFELQ